jgi:hypothetical protein
MKKQIAGALLAATFALAGCGEEPAEETADTTTFDTGAVGEDGATMISPTDTSGAAGAGADTGAAAGGRAATATPTDEPTTGTGDTATE